MVKEWLTISEAAAETGITPQAIYKRLKTTLNPYYKEQDGRKLLHRDAIDIIKSGTAEPQAQKVEAVFNMEMLHLLRQDIETIKEQLTQKDRQINLLMDELTAKNEQIKALNDGLNKALTNASQSNYLASRAIIEPEEPQHQDATETPGGENQPGGSAPEEPTAGDKPEAPCNAANDVKQEPVKKTLWQRLFNK